MSELRTFLGPAWYGKVCKPAVAPGSLNKVLTMIPTQYKREVKYGQNIGSER